MMTLLTTARRRITSLLAVGLAIGVLSFAPWSATSAAAASRNYVVTHGWGSSTIYFNKLWTADAATGEVGAAGICGVLFYVYPPAGVLCGVRAGEIITQARRAQNRNMCLKIKYAHGGPFWFDIYQGQYCR